LRWLLGEVEALWAFTGHKGSLELDVEDTVEVGLRFTNGVIGSVHLNYNQRPPVHTFEIVGTQGVIRWDNRDGAVAVYQAEDKSWENYAPPEGFERNHLFIAEMKHFVTMVRGETEPLCSLQDGVQALRIALGALESAQNEKIVRL
jgi:predicted dehydrogenase